MTRTKDIASQPLPPDFDPQPSGGLPNNIKPPTITPPEWWRCSDLVDPTGEFTPFTEQINYGSSEDPTRRRMLIPPQNPDVS